MILSEIVYDKSNSDDVLKMTVDDMRQIIKNEAKFDKFFKIQAQKSGREEIE
jgi:hypothetical protein